MIGFENIADAARGQGLGIVGAFHPAAGDAAPDGTGTLILLGPDGPDMWTAFSAAPEAKDGLADPLDRWSRRVIDALALELGASALYPFGGPPWQPFHTWAARGEGAVSSPVAMMASAGRGLWVSFRGALAFAQSIPVPQPATGPCTPCPAPCKTACPVNAFSTGTYDTAKCVAHVRSDAGAACRTGCLVRQACPAGAGLAMPGAQRSFHMAAFLKAQPLEPDRKLS